MIEAGYMMSVMQTLKPGEHREYPLSSTNVASWRTEASKANKKAGYRKYSVLVRRKLDSMIVMCNVQD